MNNILIDTKSQELLQPHSTKKSLGTKRIFIPKSMKSSLPIKYIQISSQNSHIIYFFIFWQWNSLHFLKFQEFSLHNLTINRKMHVRRPLMKRRLHFQEELQALRTMRTNSSQLTFPWESSWPARSCSTSSSVSFSPRKEKENHDMVYWESRRWNWMH